MGREGKKWHLSEDLWESPDGTMAGVLYGIGEVGVAKEVGLLSGRILHYDESAVRLLIHQDPDTIVAARRIF